MKPAVALPLVLAACVSSEIPDSERVDGVMEGEAPMTGSTVPRAEQKADWPQMGMMVVGDRGETEVVQMGTAPTVIISGATDFNGAVAALAKFCGRNIDPKGFDTQFVYREPASGNYWFDGFCG